MIVTVTLNPSVDIRFVVEGFSVGGIFRAKECQQTAGGKGLNVTRVLANLSAPVTAIGLLGGKNGEFICEQLDYLGIKHDFVGIKDNTRICIALLSGGVQSEVLGQGPKITPNELSRFVDKFQVWAKRAAVICLSGSLPPSVPGEMYAQLIEIARGLGAKVILDSSGDALMRALQARPHIVKPNLKELEAVVGRELNSISAIGSAIKEVAATGTEVVCVSLGSRGALVWSEGKLYQMTVPKVKAVNPVGSGDAMVAGLAWSLLRGLNFKTALAYAGACGVANALEKETGCVNKDMVERLFPRVIIEKVTL